MNKTITSRIKPWVVFLLALMILAFLALVAYRLITGRSLGLRSWVELQVYSVKSTVMALFDSQDVKAMNGGDFTNIIFVHHSVGRNIIQQGGLRDILTSYGFKLSDQDYIENGLTGPDGKAKGYSILVPGNNTDPDGLARMFSQPALPLPVNAMSSLLQYEVIIAKSCFPASAVKSEAQLEQYHSYYLTMRNTADLNPERLFILLTPPPLHPKETNPEEAARARQAAQWLSAPEFVKGHPNVAVFDLYSLLAGDNPAAPDFNMLKQEYQNGVDSHPNEAANRLIAPAIAEFIQKTASQYRQTFAATAKP